MAELHVQKKMLKLQTAESIITNNLMCTFKYIHIKIKENKEIRSTKKVQVIIVNTKKVLLSLGCLVCDLSSSA